MLNILSQKWWVVQRLRCCLELNDLQPMHGYYFQARVSRIVSVRRKQFSSKVRAVAATGISDWSKVAGPFKTTMAVPEKCKDGEMVHQKWIRSDETQVEQALNH